MLERMEAGTLKVFSHLHDWLEGIRDLPPQRWRDRQRTRRFAVGHALCADGTAGGSYEAVEGTAARAKRRHVRLGELPGGSRRALGTNRPSLHCHRPGFAVSVTESGAKSFIVVVGLSFNSARPTDPPLADG